MQKDYLISDNATEEFKDFWINQVRSSIDDPALYASLPYRMGLTRTKFSRIQSGESQWPLESIEHLAKVLGTDVHDLFFSHKLFWKGYTVDELAAAAKEAGKELSFTVADAVA